MMMPNVVGLIYKMCMLSFLVLAVGLTAEGKEAIAGGASPEGSNRMATGDRPKKEVPVGKKDEKLGKCNLEEGKPLPPHKISDCVEGVPKTEEIPIPEWDCQVVGTFPTQTCHWMYEDKLGCQNGGSQKMCDTVSEGSGTRCKCRTDPPFP
jgi:hypothetical protein